MLSYNGSIPGPTLRVRQGSEVVVRVRNDGDTEATVHWHGLRLDNAYDGVPFETQPPIEIGGEFTYRLRFPDAGLYWYHPHIREDYGLDMGLYGNIVVEPADPDYWPAVDRELVVTLDDVLVEDGRIAAFHEAGPTHVAMGRFGNVMLTGGETNLALGAEVGEVVRFYFTNTANTRLFNVALPGARMKLVGSDSGRYEHETIRRGSAPRAVRARHRRRALRPRRPDPARAPNARAHLHPRHRRRSATRRRRRRPRGRSTSCGPATSWRAGVRASTSTSSRQPDKTLAFNSRMPLLYGDTETTATAYTCPMHPDVIATEPGTCPQCGMKLVPAPTSYVCPMHPDVTSDTPAPAHSAACGSSRRPARAPDVAHTHEHGHEHGHEHTHDMPDGLEWEDLMPEINAASNAHNMIWKLVDVDTGKANWEIDWAFRVGDLVKIRLLNDMDQDHPMHHPFHIHGAGRFLILARDDVVESNPWRRACRSSPRADFSPGPGKTVNLFCRATFD